MSSIEIMTAMCGPYPKMPNTVNVPEPYNTMCVKCTQFAPDARPNTFHLLTNYTTRGICTYAYMTY